MFMTWGVQSTPFPHLRTFLMFSIGYSRQLQTDVGLMVSSSPCECVDLVKMHVECKECES